jgi:hypothetical protein
MDIDQPVQQSVKSKNTKNRRNSLNEKIPQITEDPSDIAKFRKLISTFGGVPTSSQFKPRKPHKFAPNLKAGHQSNSLLIHRIKISDEETDF